MSKIQEAGRVQIVYTFEKSNVYNYKSPYML